jgi:hypothetical protein
LFLHDFVVTVSSVPLQSVTVDLGVGEGAICRAVGIRLPIHGDQFVEQIVPFDLNGELGQGCFAGLSHVGRRHKRLVDDIVDHVGESLQLLQRLPRETFGCLPLLHFESGL